MLFVEPIKLNHTILNYYNPDVIKSEGEKSFPSIGVGS